MISKWGQGQSTIKLAGILSNVFAVFFCPSLVVLAWTDGEWAHGQSGGWCKHANTKTDIPDSKVHGANMGPIWGREDPGGPYVGHMNLAICDGQRKYPKAKTGLGSNSVELTFQVIGRYILFFSYALLRWLRGIEMGVFHIPVADEPIRMRCVSCGHLQIMEWRLVSIWLQETKEHDDVIKWKHFPRYWPFVREIHRFPVNSTHKGQWRGALIFSDIFARINDWVNNGEAGEFETQSCPLWRHRIKIVILITSLEVPVVILTKFTSVEVLGVVIFTSSVVVRQKFRRNGFHIFDPKQWGLLQWGYRKFSF